MNKASVTERNILPSCILALLLALPGTAMAQPDDPALYRNTEYRFAAIFPTEPSMREIAYTTRDGATVAAQQFYVEQGVNEYRVTVVNLPDRPPQDYFAVEYAGEQQRAKGEVRSAFENAYDPGIPGRQLVVALPDGRLLRSSIYIWDHNLYIAEAITTPGDLAGLKLEQSLMMLNADGSAVDTGQGNCPIARPE